MSFKLKLAMVVSALAVTGASYAAAGAAGCGIGSLIFSSNHKIHQILASTTNGSSGNQTFGISTGTSNCNAAGWAKNLQKQRDYMVANFNTLQKEGAQGTGEVLNGLASVFGCGSDSFGQFGQAVQSSYSKVFSSNTPDAALEMLRTELQTSNSDLANKCNAVAI